MTCNPQPLDPVLAVGVVLIATINRESSSPNIEIATTVRRISFDSFSRLLVNRIVVVVVVDVAVWMRACYHSLDTDRLLMSSSILES